MEVKFYQFEKRENSTKTPVSTTPTATKNCIINDEASMVKPVLKVELKGTDESPASYNYCYIDYFKRYYFINDWTYMNGLWYANCTEDVLASYKTIIGSTTKYILRASAYVEGKTNKFLKDNIYAPTLEGAYHSSYANGAGLETYIYHVSNITSSGDATFTPMPYYFRLISDGYVFLTCIDAVGTEGYVTYIMPYTEFEKVLKHMVNYTPDDVLDVLVPSIAESIYDSLKFVINCYWLPNYYFTSGTEPYSHTLNIGQISIENITYRKIPRTTDRLMIKFPIVHNDYIVNNNTDKYMDLSPYTYRTLFIPPFGFFDVESEKIITSTDVIMQAQISVDYRSGQARLDLNIDSENKMRLPSVKLGGASGQFGVPLPLMHQAINDIGLATDIGGLGLGIAGLVSAPFTGGAGLALAGAGLASNAVGSIANDVKPRTEKAGSMGSFLGFTLSYPYSKTIAYNRTSNNANDEGYPVCGRYPLYTFQNSYIKCQDGNISMKGTKQEKDIVSTYLTSGFYYE